MDVREAYNCWAEQYDTNSNKTRDLEAFALMEMLNSIQYESCLEIGCATGKNTEWLYKHAKEVVAVDLSEEMLAKAKSKINSAHVIFHQADINKKWSFATQKFDLVTFSLVLEHIEKLGPVFKKAANSTATGGYIYIGELHPFKQYSGTKARFETADGLQVVSCFNHNLSDFTEAAKKCGFEIVNLKEYFDEQDKKNIPRILSILFRKTT